MLSVMVTVWKKPVPVPVTPTVNTTVPPEGGTARVRQGGGEATLAVRLDAALPDGSLRIARGVAETAALGEGEVAVEKAHEAAVA